MKKALKRFAITAFFFVFAFNLNAATLTSATLCVNDDTTEVWLNGNNMGIFDYVNWIRHLLFLA